jgi:hypothetical protein
MVTLLLQQTPAETTRYMIAGYSVIFCIMFLYIISLVIRQHHLTRDLKMMDVMESEKE